MHRTQTTANVGTSTAVTLFHATPHVWYRDVTSGNLRHGWWDGKRWDSEPLDGFSGPNGRVAHDVGTGITVVSSATQAHVWYHDETAGDLRHAWYG